MLKHTLSATLLAALLMGTTSAKAVDVLVGLDDLGNVVAVAGDYNGDCQLIVTRDLDPQTGKLTGDLVFQPVPDTGTTVNGSETPFAIAYPGAGRDLIVDVRLVNGPTSVTLFRVDFLTDGLKNYLLGDDIVVYSDSSVRLIQCSSGWTGDGAIRVFAPDVRIDDSLADTELRVAPYRGNVWRNMRVALNDTSVGFGDGGTIRVGGTEGGDVVGLFNCSASTRVEIGLGAANDFLGISNLDVPFLKAYGDAGNDTFDISNIPVIKDFELNGGAGLGDRLFGSGNPFNFNQGNTDGFEQISNSN